MKTFALLPLLMLGPCPYDSPEGLAALNDVAHSDAGNPVAATIFDYALANWSTDERPLPDDLGVFCAIGRGFGEDDADTIKSLRQRGCGDCIFPATGTPMRFVHLLLGAPAINQSQVGELDATENYTFYRLDEKGTRIAAGGLTLSYVRFPITREACTSSWDQWNNASPAAIEERNRTVGGDYWALPGVGRAPNRAITGKEADAMCNPPYYVAKLETRAPLQFFDCWRGRRPDQATPWTFLTPEDLESLPPEQ